MRTTIHDLDYQTMAKRKKATSFFMSSSFATTLLAGIALGVFSQRNPELESFTNDIIRPITQNKIFKEWLSTIEPYFSRSESLGEPVAYTNYEEQKPAINHPVSSFVIHRSGYSTGYDARLKNPAWVYEHLTAENIQGDTDRSHFTFKEDEKIPKNLRASIASYKGQGLDQGHMAPAANHRATPETMNDTFYLTNICPQCPQLNREYWSRLERHIRELTKQYQHVYVVTGPLYLPYQEGKRKFVKYQVIGDDDIAVPSHFFKVITLEDKRGNRQVQAYVLPNAVTPIDTPFNKFKTTVQKVERAAGMILFNQISSFEPIQNP